MSRAVIDTSAIIYLLGDAAEDDEKAHAEQQNTRRTIEWMQKKKKVSSIVVPTPVLAELAYADASSDEVLKSFVEHVACRVELQPFDIEAARVAGSLLVKMHADRKPHENRHEMKFDVQIAAIAHATKARYLITGERAARSFPRYLEELSSDTEVVIAPDLPSGYQYDWTERTGSSGRRGLHRSRAG